MKGCQNRSHTYFTNEYFHQNAIIVGCLVVYEGMEAVPPPSKKKCLVTWLTQRIHSGVISRINIPDRPNTMVISSMRLLLKWDTVTLHPSHGNEHPIVMHMKGVKDLW